MVVFESLADAGKPWRWAIELSKAHLTGMGDRWTHTQAVGRRAEVACATVAPNERPVLLAAAWLHDIGYAPNVVESGFHPLDGARFLARQGVPRRIVSLVANHSCSRFEASQRDLLPQLSEYKLEVGPVANALVYADMTTGPTGRTVSVEERLAEILRRYQPDSPVGRAISEASGEIKAAVSRVEQLLAERSDQPI